MFLFLLIPDGHSTLSVCTSPDLQASQIDKTLNQQGSRSNEPQEQAPLFPSPSITASRSEKQLVVID
ncbi:hypothetical protein RRG08_040084 [Elysia crispata]|uniref:Uncharacterized protein n=1 Tax=Elysia crispata TaxID=231223 RepID=A0AAE1CN21_9GAST|nr:hypothetical protein RRG08_040084 [Elysia crispata]